MTTAIDMSPVETNWKGRPIGGCVSENVLFTPVRLLRPALSSDLQQSSPTSGMHRLMQCIAMQVQAYVTTDFFFTETPNESTLNSAHRMQHNSTRTLVYRLMTERGFQFMPANASLDESGVSSVT